MPRPVTRARLKVGYSSTGQQISLPSTTPLHTFTGGRLRLIATSDGYAIETGFFLLQKSLYILTFILHIQPHVSNSSTESSSEAVNSLNGVTGPRDYTQRRLNKPKSNSGASLVSQRSIPLRPNPLRRDTSYDTSAISSANDPDEEQSTAPNSSLNDVSREKSTSEIWASVPRPTLRAFYKLNNPLGPRWYRNYHLIPPSHLKPSMRPPTFFSPSFPPIGTTSPDHYDDEELSGSPSHSPLPTPDSSQTRVQDSSKPRSRKTSQTAPDAIDLLDLSDPWGQNWHHKSPYEFGNTTIMASLDTTDVCSTRFNSLFS